MYKPLSKCSLRDAMDNFLFISFCLSERSLETIFLRFAMHGERKVWINQQHAYSFKASALAAI